MGSGTMLVHLLLHPVHGTQSPGKWSQNRKVSRLCLCPAQDAEGSHKGTQGISQLDGMRSHL